VAGGTIDQILAKKSATDYDTKWITPSAGGGGSAEVYEQPGEPATAGLGAVWIDTDATPSVGSSRVPVYRSNAKPTAAAAGAGAAIYLFDGITTVNLNYASDGDTNGLIYYLGTRDGAFVSPVPQTNGAIDLVGTYMRLLATSLEPGYQTYRAVDRAANSAWASSSSSNPSLAIELYSGRSLKPNRVAIRHRSDAVNNGLLHFAVEGSIDGVSWTLLRQVDDTVGPAQNEWRSWTLTSSVSYRFLRTRMTGVDASGQNYMVIGEIEWYGQLTEGGLVENRYQISDGTKWYSVATAVELPDGTVNAWP